MKKVKITIEMKLENEFQAATYEKVRSMLDALEGGVINMSKRVVELKDSVKIKYKEYE